METQTANANMALLSQMRQTIDGHIDEVQKLCDQISTNQKIRSLTYSANPITATDRAKIYEVVQTFASYKYITPFIDDFYVYLQNIDQVEIVLNQCADSDYGGQNVLLQFINLTGFNGMTFFEPLELHNITVALKN